MIGGPPRMGKSSLAQLILKENGIPYVSTDALTVMLEPIGQPTFYGAEKANQFFPHLELFVDRILRTAPNYVIEGDAFSPEHVKKLQDKYEVKSVFLTMSKINPESITANTKHDTWTDDISDSELRLLCDRVVTASKDIQAQCERLGLPCIDLSSQYNQQFKNAYTLLIS